MARLDNLDYEVNGVTTNYEIVPEIAPLFNATTAYAAGDTVIKDGHLYRFNTAHAAGAWIGTDADEITVGEELTSHGADITELKADFTEIREPGKNLGYFTEFSDIKSAVGVSVKYLNSKQIALWGTLASWVSINVLRGNTQVYAGAPNFVTNLTEGTYTLKCDPTLICYYGTSWSDKQVWSNGATVTLDSPVCVFLRPTDSTQSFGTQDTPTVYNFELYEGETSVVPTAIDRVARDEIETVDGKIGAVTCDRILPHGDFDYERPYNIFNGTTWTKDKKVNYLDGTLADNTGTCVTDYMEIDNTKGYLCLNIYVVLAYEQGLTTGGNRVWVHSNWAFYDANKEYICTNSANTDTSKIIPTNAKYVRLTASSEAIIPFAVLFYGEYTSQQWVRYTEYRKQIVQYPVFSATGMEKLNMVMFGDSITQGIESTSGAYFSYVDYANDTLRSNIINCGLGGSRMSQGSPDAIGLGSFASLCENIASDDQTAWDALDAYASATHPDWVYHINDLKSVDWDGIQAVGIFYGANDWHNNVPVGAEYNENPLNYDGACAYGLKLLLTKYPHLQAIVFTPIYRETDGTNSDAPNGAGLNMDDYGASLKNVQTVFHCPVVDMGNEININRYTIYSYTATNDGTHPRKLLGLERIGRFVAESIKRYIQPY